MTSSCMYVARPASNWKPIWPSLRQKGVSCDFDIMLLYFRDDQDLSQIQFFSLKSPHSDHKFLSLSLLKNSFLSLFKFLFLQVFVIFSFLKCTFNNLSWKRNNFIQLNRQNGKDSVIPKKFTLRTLSMPMYNIKAVCNDLYLLCIFVTHI